MDPCRPALTALKAAAQKLDTAINTAERTPEGDDYNTLYEAIMGAADALEPGDARDLAAPFLPFDQVRADLIAMLSEASDNHAARRDDLTLADAVEEIAAWDRVLAYLRGAGAADADLRFITDNMANESDRAALRYKLEVQTMTDRALAQYGLTLEAWDGLPPRARAALTAALV